MVVYEIEGDEIEGAAELGEPAHESGREWFPCVPIFEGNEHITVY